MVTESQVNPWVDDAKYRKYVTQLRLRLNGIMEPLMLYGQKPYVEQAIEEVIKLTENFGLRVRGYDKPWRETPKSYIGPNYDDRE